jgi:sporulation protein YlmC with PRC-barrel domain
MSKELLGAVSAMALFAGVAAAQDAGPGATPAPATPQTTTPAPAPTTPAATAGETVRAADMIGRSVQGSDGKPLGKVKDAVVDAQSGKIQKLVIASGGFLGLGAKNVALDFDRVEVRPEGGIVAKDVTRKDVEAMPRYDVAAETRPLDKPPPPAAAAPGTTGVGGVGAGGGGAIVPPPRPAQQ